MILKRTFFTRPDTLAIARDLLGKRLVTRINGEVTAGIISETEAYVGEFDKASHAFKGRRTSRTETMYRVGGTAYVYLCYGIHSLFNVVTHRENHPHAVLIRGIFPESGQSIMLARSGRPKWSATMGNGPGKVSTLLGIHYSHSGIDLINPHPDQRETAIWIEDTPQKVSLEMIEITPRVGVDYAGEDALLPYRFIYKKTATP